MENSKFVHIYRNVKFHIFIDIFQLYSFVETIAFYAALTLYDTIPEDRPVLFNEIELNEGQG